MYFLMTTLGKSLITYAINIHMYNERFPPHFAEKYNNIPYVVLDVPKIIPDDNFIDVWNEYNIPILRKLDKIDPKYPFTPEEAQAEFLKSGRTNEYTQPNWLGCYAHVGKADDRWTQSIFDGAKLLPRFFEQIYEYLPINRLQQVLFWSNQRPIGVHRDLHEQLPFPSSIRMMIQDNNPQPTFFLVPVPDSTSPHQLSSRHPTDWSTTKFVDTNNASSNVFMYNNKQWAHGALKLEGYSKILCSLSIDYDWIKLEKLLDASIAKNGNNL